MMVVQTLPGIPRADVAIQRASGLWYSHQSNGTNADRAARIVAACAVAVSGDTIWTGPGTFAFGSTAFLAPDGVTFKGAGKQVTTWTSTVLSSVGTCFTVGNNSAFDGICFDSVVADGQYRLTCGGGDSSTGTKTAYFRNCKINSESDGFYIWPGSGVISIYAFNCEVYAKFDGAAMLGSSFVGHLFDFESCYIYSTATFTGADPHKVSGVRCTSGTTNLRNSKITLVGDGSSIETYGITCGTTGVFNIDNTKFSCTAGAGSIYDLENSAGGSVTYQGGSGSDTKGRYKINGSVTLKSISYGTRRCIAFTCYTDATDVTATTGLARVLIPVALNGHNIVSIYARTPTAGTGTGLTSIQVKRVRSGSAVSVLSTVCSIDPAEKGSDTAATPAVIDTANDDLATYDAIEIDVTAATSTPAKGLQVVIETELP